MIVAVNDRQIVRPICVNEHPELFAMFTSSYLLGMDIEGEGKRGDKIELGYAIIPASYKDKIDQKSNAGAALIELFYARGLHRDQLGIIGLEDAITIIRLYEVAEALQDQDTKIEYGAHRMVFAECMNSQPGCMCERCLKDQNSIEFVINNRE